VALRIVAPGRISDVSGKRASSVTLGTRSANAERVGRVESLNVNHRDPTLEGSRVCARRVRVLSY